MRQIQNRIERSRPEEACHHGISHGGVFVIFSVVLVVVKAAAIRLSSNPVCPHHRTRLFGCTDDKASGGRRACASLAAPSVSTFSLFTGMFSIVRRTAECACRRGR